MIHIKNYIDGTWRASKSGAYMDVFEPATGKVYAKLAKSSDVDVQDAVDSAQAALPTWSALNIEERAEILMRLSRHIEKNLHQLAEAESKDNGKPLKLAKRVDVPRAAANFRFYAQAITQYHSQSFTTRLHGMNLQSYVLRQPLGVVACISPWNLPLYLFSWKIAPALAAGNTVVAKPSEVTPYTAHLLTELCNEAGLPPGVLNVIHGLGHEAGQALISHPSIAGVSFTGGTKTGETIARTVAPNFKPLSLELGGKNPNIIFADCDYEKMLKTTVHSSFANQGQICLCGSRILVEDSLYSQFKKDFIERVAQLKVGDPLDPDVNLGAVVSQAHQEKILSYIDWAKNAGASILAGGHAHRGEARCADGYFIAPTVIEGLPNDCKINQEEVFGPVVTLQSFSSESGALALANECQYGLASSIWTQDVSRAHRMASGIESGIVWINCWLQRDLRTPFGGMKQSGIGREGGVDALDFFTEPKSITTAF